jgi:hypothetical protein
MFEINNNQGFHIVFKNNIEVSVQFGLGSYSDNHFNTDSHKFLYGYVECQNAEIAIKNKNGEFITKEYCKKFDPAFNSNTLSFVTPDELPDILIWARNRRFGSRYGSNSVKY